MAGGHVRHPYGCGPAETSIIMKLGLETLKIIGNMRPSLQAIIRTVGRCLH